MTSLYRKQRVFGIIGRSGSGKTRLVSRLISCFCQRGLSVSTIKHTHHGVDMDTPGKDTFQHRQSGAAEVMLATPARWFLQHQSPTPPKLNDLLKAMQPVDLILVEGFHADVPACVEVWRPITGKEPLFINNPHIQVIATDNIPMKNPEEKKVFLPLDDTQSIADYIESNIFLWNIT
ncbi:molybdopterin-guanine dinucleotide biosynthesis protein B [Acetobacter fabarum]|uniref:Molybdopterin-guanine dinucleotide biosynthesis protein B n=1 Tax=Acetobacter fabarum TaxID=483199 RepID=A0A269XWA3_9PROT|nr:molybdopterin-guanine dinucleotide biosynthesis protein B [Acetobacter fabarum]PAK77568.1 molybdopterin-guanine dinucleotide biosynthesis protein B [Acetobacter fabarum]PEN28933.1 molybdopterin-guanine dinucleotide biosynthesis protein MobB [Acetobacter fabarum]